MFTGLIELVGKVSRRTEGLAIGDCQPLFPLKLGESIAVDGVCLTVAKLTGDGFIADVSEETLERTTLAAKANLGGVVNLERALRLSDRLGGHLVSGHVDGLGEVISIKESNNSWVLELCWEDSDFGKYICKKGSVTVDGISLTVGGFSEQGCKFWIAIIPHTWMNTSLKYLQVGCFVNLEADLMAKYAESILKKDGSNLFLNTSKPDEQVSKSWLSDHGWI